MDKYYLNLITNEVKNFKKLQKQWGYDDLDDLIGHYIEEDVISSRKDLVEVLNILKAGLGITLKTETFNDWWISRKQYNLIA